MPQLRSGAAKKKKQKTNHDMAMYLFQMEPYNNISLIFAGVQSVLFSYSVVSDSLRPHESQHARPPCPSPTPGVHSDSRPSSQ